MKDWWDELDSNPVNFKESKGSVEGFRVLLFDRFENLVEVSISYYLNEGIISNVKYEPNDDWFEDDVNDAISRAVKR